MLEGKWVCPVNRGPTSYKCDTPITLKYVLYTILLQSFGKFSLFDFFKTDLTCLVQPSLCALQNKILVTHIKSYNLSNGIRGTQELGDL